MAEAYEKLQKIAFTSPQKKGKLDGKKNLKNECSEIHIH